MKTPQASDDRLRAPGYDCEQRALMVASFFSIGGPTSRPRFVGSVLADLMPVDLVTSDFDHGQKTGIDHQPCEPFKKVFYVKTLPYGSNISAARILSHLLFALRAAAYFKKHRDKYSVVYVTAPLNLLAWRVCRLAKGKTTIVDVVDIWPDVLPFSPTVRRAFAPVLFAWKWFFKAAIAKADIVTAVSDEFTREAARYANAKAKVKRFFIGHQRLRSDTSKQPLFTIAYVGNIGRLYDFDTLVDVLSEDELRGCMQLFLIGKGDRQGWLIDELERRKIPHRFFGVVFDADQLATILRSCHVGFNGYINTTAAFSYKAATYLAAGLPLINSMTGDLQRLVVNHGLGENYEGGNRGQLKRCLMRLYRHGTTTMATNCERFFASEVETSQTATGMREFFVSNLLETQDSHSRSGHGDRKFEEAVR